MHRPSLREHPCVLALVLGGLLIGCQDHAADKQPPEGSTHAAVEPAPSPVASAAGPADPRVERGRYLTSAVVDCVHCHTHRDHNDYQRALGPAFAGGEVLGPEWKMPGTIVTPNLTPDPDSGLGGWTDAQVKRAIREGVHRDGYRLFPLMPAHYFQRMSDEDVDAIVAFLRSLPPTPMPTKERTKLAIDRATLPPLPAITAPVPPPADDPVARGEYLVTIANCRTCHAPTKGGQELPDRYMAGGVYFTTPFGNFPTPNITPDEETGIGAWTDDEIKRVLTTGVRKNGAMVKANLMPWWLYKNLTEKDLNAIVAYLRSLKPVKSDINDLKTHFPLGG